MDKDKKCVIDCSTIYVLLLTEQLPVYSYGVYQIDIVARMLEKYIMFTSSMLGRFTDVVERGFFPFSLAEIIFYKIEGDEVNLESTRRHGQC